MIAAVARPGEEVKCGRKRSTERARSNWSSKEEEGKYPAAARKNTEETAEEATSHTPNRRRTKLAGKWFSAFHSW